MKIAVTGANGLVGSALAESLAQGGHEVLRVQRRASAPGELAWDPDAGRIDAARLEGLDAAVHLAGESIATRWNDELKQRILRSRTEGTAFFSRTLASLASPPPVLVCASAVGIYGNRGDEELDESSTPGRGFLADVCRRWEASADPARAGGIRVVHARLGAVLSPKGGALAQMLTPVKLGLGGKLGSGRQYMSWVTIDDVVAAIVHCIAKTSLDGPVNVTAPGPVTNERFIEALASVLHRPSFATVPAFALRLLMGEMADELLLSSARVYPKRLVDSGFAFRDPEISRALARLLDGHDA